MDYEEAEKFYSDPENLRPAGPARKRGQGKVLTSHVPVRFSPSLIAAVKAIADMDGVTVSTWIRNVVTREVNRRATSVTSPSNILDLAVEMHRVQEVGATEATQEEVSFLCATGSLAQ